jgi:FAD/FMN-containing dehydrogenase
MYFELKSALQGKVLLPGDDLYAAAITLWNAAVKTRPALIARCENINDVVAAVKIAGKYSWRLTVKGGGHDWSGLALSENGLVIDLSEMRDIQINRERKEATMEGGATAGDLLAAADPFDLYAVTGAGSTIGMAGLTMGGGYGPLTPKYGLALDNLLSAVLVMADGKILTVSETENEALYWAIKGGGGNFGVLVSMRIRLHDAQPILSCLFRFPGSEAESVFKFYNDCAWAAPDELSMITGLIPGMNGEAVVTVALTWCGNIEQGRHLLEDLQRIGPAVGPQIQQLKYKDLLTVFDTFVTYNSYNDMKTRWLPGLTPESIAVILKAGAEMTSALSTISLQYFYGLPARIPLSSTAFGLRKPHILVLITSSWKPEDDANASVHCDWGRKLCDDLAPYALPGGYLNVLTVKESHQILLSHGENWPKLRKVKDFYDPEGVFSSFPIDLPVPVKAEHF